MTFENVARSYAMICQIPFFKTARVFKSSLRANGSRERAPDDRLREAIHRAAQRKNGLLRRLRPPSLVELRRTSPSPQRAVIVRLDGPIQYDASSQFHH